MTTYRYAAYGSNLHWLRLQRRVPSARLLGTSLLAGWALHFNKRGFRDGTAKCNIAEGGDGVHMAIYEIALTEKIDLDRCEGLGFGYNEATVHAPGFGDCSTYVADPGHVFEELRPTDWYKEMVVLGCRAHGFPPAYRRGVEAVGAIEDLDESRAREQWRIVEELRNGPV